LSAGDKDTDRLGEAADPPLGPFSSALTRNRRPITGVWERSNVKSIVRPE